MRRMGLRAILTEAPPTCQGDPSERVSCWWTQGGKEVDQVLGNRYYLYPIAEGFL